MIANLTQGFSLWKLGLECAGLNLLVAGLAAGGAEVGLWAAGSSGSGVGLLVGLAVGVVGHSAGAAKLTE